MQGPLINSLMLILYGMGILALSQTLFMPPGMVSIDLNAAVKSIESEKDIDKQKQQFARIRFYTEKLSHDNNVIILNRQSVITDLPDYTSELIELLKAEK